MLDFVEYEELKPKNIRKDLGTFNIFLAHHTYGKSNKPRDLEPPMFDLLKGGYENNIEDDYLKNKDHLEELSVDDRDQKPLKEVENENNVKYRIRKTQDKFVSE